jgi:hypothetical protein
VGGAYGTHGRGDESVQGFGGKAWRKETTRKIKAYPRREDGIRMDLGEIGWGGGGGVDSIGSGYGPLADCCECGDEPSYSDATELVGPDV